MKPYPRCHETDSADQKHQARPERMMTAERAYSSWTASRHPQLRPCDQAMGASQVNTRYTAGTREGHRQTGNSNRPLPAAVTKVNALGRCAPCVITTLLACESRFTPQARAYRNYSPYSLILQARRRRQGLEELLGHPVPGIGRNHVCSMFARTSRYGAAATGTKRHRLSGIAAQFRTSWRFAALSGTVKLAEQRTLNLREHRSSCRVPHGIR